MKFVLNLLKFLLVIVLINGHIIAQEEEIIEEEVVDDEIIVKAERKTISLIELTELMSIDQQEITIYNCKIVAGSEDSKLAKDKFFFKIFEILSKENKEIEQLLFHDCIFDFNDKEYIVFKEWKINNLKIIGCEFYGRVAFDNIYTDDRSSIFIENCTFKDQIEVSNNSVKTNSLTFSNCNFRTEVLVDLELKNLLVDTCRFIADTNLFNSRAEVKTFYQFEVNNYPVDRVIFTRNRFDNRGLGNLFSVNFALAEFESLELISNSMQTLNLSEAEVTKTFLVDSLFVDDYIGILNFDFPDANTNISWYNIGGEKLSIFTVEEKLTIPYQAKTDKQLSENLKYNDLISAYNKFNSLYHDRGDIESANASYVEIKDIETRKQAYIQEVNPSLNNLINYKLNEFLKFFSDYATNPGKSLKQSIFMILLFAFLYVFTFSGWDKVTLKFFISEFAVFDEFTKYKKNISIYQILEEKREKLKKKDLESGNEMEKEPEHSNKKQTRFERLFSKPIYFIGKFRYNIIPGLVKIVGFSKKPWNSHNNFDKAVSGFLIIFISLVFTLYAVIVRIFVSTMLSLNSFVVVGFGSLPEEDRSIAMYLTIIEAIIGWFLLTIFTITLLSQVLQNA